MNYNDDRRGRIKVVSKSVGESSMKGDVVKGLVVVLILAGLALWVRTSTPGQRAASTPKVVLNSVEQPKASVDRPSKAGRGQVKGSDLVLGKTDVLLLVHCTLRKDRLEIYGYDKPTSPFWTELAKHGVVFDHHISQASWTRPSLGSILTGHYPRHIALDNPGTKGSLERVLADKFVTVAEIFQDAGYTTVGAVANPNAKTDFGMEQGFERYGEPARVFKDKPKMRSMRELGDYVFSHLPDSDKPVFVMVMTVDTHEQVQFMDQDKEALRPFYEELKQVKENATYDASVHFLDRQLGNFIKQFKKQRPNTLIVQTADHGEGLRTPVHHGKGHGGFLYPTTVSIPHLWVHSSLPQGKRVKSVTRNIDILPTLVDILGISTETTFAGRSYAAALMGDVEDLGQIGFSETFFGKHNKAAAYGSDYYLIVDRKGGTQQLFAADDYFAMNDLMNTQPEVALQYAQSIKSWEEEWPISTDVQEVKISEDLREQLEAIGYVE